MLVDSDAPRPWVEVVEKTFLLAFTDKDGKPARISYTINEQIGESIQALPGGLKITRVPKEEVHEGEVYRVRAQEIVINAAHVVSIETTYRLIKRERLTAKQMMELPGVAEVEEKLRQHNREMREK